ncbi:MAG: transglutaminase domain-containing protein [Deltaproteobacteria bacterium]|nr:transglutaminase domain-containing protein [Deltaproteobacteria bacterium]
MKRKAGIFGVVAGLVLIVGCRSEPVVQDATATAPVPTGEDAPAVPAPEVQAAPEVDEAERARVARALDRVRQGGEAWYGVYVMGKKVGHGHMSWHAPTEDTTATVGVPVAAIARFSMEMSVSGGGNANVIKVDEIRMYGAEWPHPLVQSVFTQAAAGFVETRVGVPGPDGMRINRSIGTTAEPERVGAKTVETLVDALRAAPLGIDGLVYGKTVAASSWTWEREADEVLEVTPLREETHTRAGVEQKVAVLQVKYTKTGVTATTTVSADGVVLEMSLGPAITMKLEEKDVARSGVSGLDVMGSGIKSPQPLGDPGRVERLVFELETGSPDVSIPDGGHQQVERLGPERLRVTRTRGPGGAVAEGERADALADDPTIDAQNPAVKQHAASLVAADATPADKVKIISEWVYATLDKRLATHLPTASKVLEAKVGDCTEHTWLTVALLRALGVPARPVYGVAYAGDREQSFAYHAWVEVELDGKWLWIDPTWGQDVADATHLQLGVDLGAVAPTLGTMKIDKLAR